MTKDQAIQAMKQGRKVTHLYFTPDEWIMDIGYKYEFEDGCVCSHREFWQYRQGKEWFKDWSIYDA